jgi:hypothetical protein
LWKSGRINQIAIHQKYVVGLGDKSGCGSPGVFLTPISEKAIQNTNCEERHEAAIYRAVGTICTAITLGITAGIAYLGQQPGRQRH